MEKNVGILDKIIRVILVAIAIYFTYKGGLDNIWNYVLTIFALAMTLTSLSGYCILYTFCGVSTKKDAK